MGVLMDGMRVAYFRIGGVVDGKLGVWWRVLFVHLWDVVMSLCWRVLIAGR
jgi:hypothetical protein